MSLKGATEKAIANAQSDMSQPSTFWDHTRVQLTYDELFASDWETMSLLPIEHQEFIAAVCDEVNRYNGRVYQDLLRNAQKPQPEQAPGLFAIRDETTKALHLIASRCDELAEKMSAFMTSLQRR